MTVGCGTHAENAQESSRVTIKNSTQSAGIEDGIFDKIEERLVTWFKALPFQYRFELPLLGFFLGVEFLDRIVDEEVVKQIGLSQLPSPQTFYDIRAIMDPEEKMKCQVVTNYSGAHINASGMISVGEELLNNTTDYEQRFVFGHEMAHFNCGHFDTPREVRFFRAFLAPVMLIGVTWISSKLIAYVVRKNQKIRESKIGSCLTAIENGIKKIGYSPVLNAFLCAYCYFKSARINERQADLVAAACDPLIARAGISYFKRDYTNSIFRYLNPFVLFHLAKEKCGLTAHPSGAERIAHLQAYLAK
jgi:hypothetical protein